MNWMKLIWVILPHGSWVSHNDGVMTLWAILGEQ